MVAAGAAHQPDMPGEQRDAARVGRTVAERRQARLERREDGCDQGIALVRAKQRNWGNQSKDERDRESGRAAKEAASDPGERAEALPAWYAILRAHASAPTVGQAPTSNDNERQTEADSDEMGQGDGMSGCHRRIYLLSVRHKM